MNNPNDSILLASGGMDSTTLAYWMIDKNIKFRPVFMNYGQHCMKTELETLRSVLPENLVDCIDIINISDIYKGASSRLIREPDLWNEHLSHEDFYLPYRNLLFLTTGSAYAQSHGYSYVYTAFINSNHAKEIDCSAQFFDKLEELLGEYGSVKVKMPFRDLSKYDVAKIGISLQAPIGHTFSCQASPIVPCGACPNCVDRLEAFSKLGNNK